MELKFVQSGLKRVFSYSYLVAALLTLLWCAYRGIVAPDTLLLPLILMSAAPLIQRLIPFDDWQVPHHKLRLPRVSFLVLSSMAAILLFGAPETLLLWLALINLGGFLLDTYWASFERR